MEALLKENRFYMYHQCNCGGTKTQKYKSGEYGRLEVWVKPDRNSFTIRRAQMQIDQGLEMNLESKLNKAIQDVKDGVMPLR